MEDVTCDKTSVISILDDRVTALYHFRDHFFESHTLEDAHLKQEKVKEELRKTLELFEQEKENAEREKRSMYCYLRGRALNILPAYDQAAEELLARAVKLDPRLVAAWNELGECSWKKGDVEAARNCFRGALKHERNKVSLRKLSMVLRQLRTLSNDEHVKNVEESVSHAKEAVHMDTSDGESWEILANAYLSSFFNIAADPRMLKHCRSAYQHAEKDVISRSNPYLHYNKAMALKYEEEYEEVLKSLEHAQALDPTCDDAREKEKFLVKYLSCVQDLCKSYGKMKPKRLQQMLQSIDTNLLGPYSGGSYVSPAGLTANLKPVPLSELQPGINAECVVLGRVVCSVHSEDSVPFTFCMVDKGETCVAVTVYNLMQGRGVIIGDAVAIPEPYFSQVKVKYKDKSFSYQSLRVETPLVMVVNGKKLGRDHVANAQLSTSSKNE